MTKFGLYSAAVLCGVMLTGEAAGQSPSPAPTPTQPILGRARDGTWTVAYKYNSPPPSKQNKTKDAPADAGHEIVSLRVEKTGKTYHAIAVDAAQEKTEVWYMDGVEVSKSPGTNKFGRVTSSSPFYLDFSKEDFDELSWIGMDNYKGVIDGPDGFKQFVFEVKNTRRRRTVHEHATDGDLAELAEKLHLVEAGASRKQAETKMLESQYGDTVSRVVLDILNQLPVEYDDGVCHRTYTFSEAPVPIPADVVQLMHGFSEKIRRATVPVPPP